MRMLFLATAIAVGCHAAAYAADMTLPDTTPAPPPAQELPESAFGGAYLSLIGGGGWIGATDVASAGDPMTFDDTTGYTFGGALGYDVSPHFSIEGQVTYSAFDNDSATVYGVSYPVPDTGGTSLVGMVNLLFGHDFGGFRPYVGVGAGAAYVQLDSAIGDEVHDSDVTWAAQALAGFDVAVSDRVSIGGRYRFQYTGETEFLDGDTPPAPVVVDESYSNIVEAVLKFRLN